MANKGNQQLLKFSITMTLGLIIASSAGPLWQAPFALIMSGAALLPFFDYRLIPYARKL